MCVRAHTHKGVPSSWVFPGIQGNTLESAHVHGPHAGTLMPHGKEPVLTDANPKPPAPDPPHLFCFHITF